MPRFRQCLQGLALLFAAYAGAATAAGPEAADLEALQADSASPTRAEPGLVVSPRGLAYAYARRDTLTSAAAGDSRLVFVAQPLTASVAVLDRFTGQQLGQLPAPPGGWLLPFSLRVPREGHVVVLDSGGFPSPTAPSVPRVYDYNVFYNPHTLQLHATLERVVRFDGLPVVFAEDVEVIARRSVGLMHFVERYRRLTDLTEPERAKVRAADLAESLDRLMRPMMAEAGVDITGQTSKHLDDVKEVPFDYVVTVCDHAHESCPLFPGHAKRVHAGFDDPPRLALDAKSESEALGHYRRVRDEIRAFVDTLPAALAEPR